MPTACPKLAPRPLAGRAPHTRAAFTALLPYRQRLIHARWSGKACWVPLGDYQLGVGYENDEKPSLAAIYCGIPAA